MEAQIQREGRSNFAGPSLSELVTGLDRPIVPSPRHPLSQAAFRIKAAWHVLSDPIPSIDRENNELQISQNPEYVRLETTLLKSTPLGFRELTQAGLHAYARFLASDAPTEAKMFATSEEFTRYMKRTVGYDSNNALGPHFQLVLTGLGSKNRTVFEFIRRNLPVFTSLDSSWLNILRRDEQPPQQANRFLDTATGLISTAFDADDSSEWRAFVLQNFSTIADTVFVRRGKEIDYRVNLDKVKAIFEALKQEDWAFIAGYIGLMGEYDLDVFYNKVPDALRLKEMLDELDQEVLKGQTARAKVFVQGRGQFNRYFHQGVYSVQGRFWNLRFLEGDISERDFLSVPKLLRVLDQTPTRIERLFGVEAHKAIRSTVDTLARSAGLFDQAHPLAALVRRGIYPTEILTGFVKEQGSAGMKRLALLRRQTETGNFDPTDELQRELEWGSFLKLGGRPQEREFFLSLPFIPDANLSPKFKNEAEAAAFEAATLYWFIKQRVEMGRNLAVIGNERYGALFIVDPLRTDLEELGVRVSNYHVGSSDPFDESRKTLHDIQVWLNEGDFDDIVIADGTNNLGYGEMRRFPTALRHYYEWFTAEGNKDKYSIAYWFPRRGKQQLTLGNKQVDYREPGDNSPQVILADPVIPRDQFDMFPTGFESHEPAYFDDPENRRSIREFVFMPHGVRNLSVPNTEELIRIVQDHMVRTLPEMIEKANPSG